MLLVEGQAGRRAPLQANKEEITGIKSAYLGNNTNTGTNSTPKGVLCINKHKRKQYIGPKVISVTSEDDEW